MTLIDCRWPLRIAAGTIWSRIQFHGHPFGWWRI